MRLDLSIDLLLHLRQCVHMRARVPITVWRTAGLVGLGSLAVRSYVQDLSSTASRTSRLVDGPCVTSTIALCRG